MGDEDKTEKVLAVRNELRSARNKRSISISEERPDTLGVSISDHREERSIPGNVSGPGAKDVRNDGSHVDPDGSSTQKSRRVRSQPGRPGEDNSSIAGSATSDTSRTGRSRGRLIAEDEIPQRHEESEVPTDFPKEIKRGRPKKVTLVPVQPRKETIEIREDDSKSKGFKLPWFQEGTKLSTAEVIALEEPLIAALEADFGYVDQYIWYQTSDVTQEPIWSDLDTEDVTKLARVMLKQGQRSAVAATTVRSLVQGSDYLSALILTVPRVIKTVDHFKKAPKKEKVNWLERKRAVRNYGTSS